MDSNSKIFTETIFGVSSGSTAEVLASNDRNTQEKYLNSGALSSMSTRVPRVPSNQKIARDK
jgi:hypothetical protein